MMDISDSYEQPQQSQSQQQQQLQLYSEQSNFIGPHQLQHQLQQSSAQQQQLLQQSTEQQQQQMHYDMHPSTNGFGPSTLSSSMSTTTAGFPMQTAIPLPPPPSMSAALNKSQQTHMQAPPTSTDIDIDALLLQQFSCLGTTDHEDLINQFQSLMNNQMNKDSAKFFLEMSNWNLQTAVGCYLDFCNIQTVPSMKIVEQCRPSELRQVWRLQNDGTEAWPNGCYLMSPRHTRRIDMPSLKAGETCDILADMPATQQATNWRMCTPNGWYFGEVIWMVPPGNCSSPAELAERMSQLRTPSNATNSDSLADVNFVISLNMD